MYKDAQKRAEYLRQYYRDNKDRIDEYNREYHKKHRDKINSRRRKYCEKNRDKIREYKLKRKMEVLTHYGNGSCCCVVCGEDRMVCLSIDHINGNGRKHLQKIGRGGGADFYCWLKKNDYPRGYQTLCMNCQFIKKHSSFSGNEDHKIRLIKDLCSLARKNAFIEGSNRWFVDWA